MIIRYLDPQGKGMQVEVGYIRGCNVLGCVWDRERFRSADYTCEA